MKKDITYIAQEQYLAVARELGLELLDQAGYTKVHGPKGRQCYVARTKTVGKVTISGFEVPPEVSTGVTDLKGESFGSVKQVLDLGRPAADILASWRVILEHMATLPPAEKVKRSALPRPTAAAVEGKVEDPGKAARRELIERIAREKGLDISPKTMAEFAQAPAQADQE